MKYKVPALSSLLLLTVIGCATQQNYPPPPSGIDAYVGMSRSTLERRLGPPDGEADTKTILGGYNWLYFSTLHATFATSKTLGIETVKSAIYPTIDGPGHTDVTVSDLGFGLKRGMTKSQVNEYFGSPTIRAQLRWVYCDRKIRGAAFTSGILALGFQYQDRYPRDPDRALLDSIEISRGGRVSSCP
jgi:outer membrane protein assembly factor BamE (lipoprotein component of BamABCDE complex)